MLTAAERADLRLLPLPLRTLALNASAGSYSDIYALCKYWKATPDPIDENSCRVLLPVLLIGLYPSDVPNSLPTDPTTDIPIQRAKHCLDLIALFAHFLAPSEVLTTFISTYHHRVFQWLNFLSIHFVGTHRLSPAARRLAAVTEQSMIFTIAGILNSLNTATMHLRPDTHAFLVDVVIDIWRKLLYIDVASMEPHASVLSVRIGMVLQCLLASPNYLPVIDKLGGRSSFVVLYLSHVEQTTQRFAAHPLTASICMPFKTLALVLLSMFSCFMKEHFEPQVKLHDVIPRSSVVVNLLIDRYNAIRRLGFRDDADLLGDLSGVIRVYCSLITTDSWSLSPPRLLQALKSGTPKNICTINPPSLDLSEDLEALATYMTTHSVYPAILKHTSKLKALPNRPSMAAWTRFDGVLAHYYPVWTLAGEIAQEFEKCSTCMVPQSERNLKICGGCRTILYCSIKCQRIGREQGHRLHCKLLQWSQAHSSLIGGCHGLVYLAIVETFQITHQMARLTNLLSSTTLRPNEIPLILVDMSTLDINIIKMADYPDIFGNEVWEKELIPRFKAMMDAGQMPRYLTVLAMPQGVRRSYVLGAVASGIMSGLVDWDTLSLVEKAKSSWS